MPNPSVPESQAANVSEESFKDILSQYERSQSYKPEEGQGREGTVVSISADSVFLDIGLKIEGVLPLAPFLGKGETVKPGDKLLVAIKGRTEDGYYDLTRGKIQRPTDWVSLEKAFADKATITGTVTSVVKGGLSVDIGVRAFMPASRSGVRDAAEMEKLVGQEVRCRITKLDVTDEDVVVDRRVIAEEEETATKERRYAEIKEGDTVYGHVRSITDYGAFVDIGGVDALLHVSDISWHRVNKPADVLTVGQQIEGMVLKIDPEKHRISIGMKQLQPAPWDSASEKYKVGERVRGTVTRLMDFGVFVELEPGIEGLVHISEMSWAKKVRKPGDVVRPGETVEAVILGVNAAERRISLGLKQTLGDPWTDVLQKYPVGSVIEGPITNIMKFGAFVQLTEGVEGMVHVSEISAEKRINHPQDVLKLGQTVRAEVLAIDVEKRQLKLSMKQLAPTGLDEFIAEHKEGDLVTGRMVELSGELAGVELGEGIRASCRILPEGRAEENNRVVSESSSSKIDLSALSSMLQARWKGGATANSAKPEALHAGQVRKFRITKMDAGAKKIELELA